MSYRARAMLLIVIDFALVNLALWLALWLRFDGAIPTQYFITYQRLTLIHAAVRLVCFYFLGLYNRLWAYASVAELMAIVYAVTLGSLINFSFGFILQNRFPRSVILLSWGLNILLVGGSRLFWRIRREKQLWPAQRRKGRRTLLVGAGDAGSLVLRDLYNSKEHNYQPVGFVDDDPMKQKQRLMGLPVLGTRADLPQLVERYHIKEVILAMPSTPAVVVREVVEICRPLGVGIKILPSIPAVLEGRVTVSSIREVQVEDLLGREPVEVNLEEMVGYLRNRVMLVTGAGGSIGSEICRQAARFGPKCLLLLGHGENSIYEIDLELGMTNPQVPRQTIITDVRDRRRVEQVFSRFRPEVVFHAAANKHVPLMEEHPEEAIKTNVFGSKNVAEAARRWGAERFVLISTDKAVNPASVMGASKRLAEMAVMDLNHGSGNTRFMAVRFGNVLGSRGSVVPLFQKQIAAGGPITVTHQDMCRYFMTIPEAVQLVIQAGAMGQGGEVFVLDMGEPVKIIDLAQNLIRLSGLEPGVDIKIEITGIRPGEKLFEEILSAEEGTVATKNRRIYISNKNGWDSQKLVQGLDRLERMVFSGTPGSIHVMLQHLLENYHGNRLVTELFASRK